MLNSLTNPLRGYVTADHTFTVPLDHERAAGEQVSVYAREVRRVGGGELPWLLFLQGGPGGKAPRPVEISGWLERACRDFRVLLLDQRGTGRSTPVNRQTLVRRGTSQAQAEYAAHFRADSIIRDCELIREELLGPDQAWSVLGQSFGGFCATTYLSFAPDFLSRVMITGGLPPLEATADDIYRTTFPKVLARNDEYYRQYPADVEAVASIRDVISQHGVQLPRGDTLTPQRMQFLGLPFGMTDGYSSVHYLFEEAWIDREELSDSFLAGVEDATSLINNPLFALLHEASYTQQTASGWSASRILDEFPSLDPSNGRFSFSGEMIYPWMFDSYASLRPFRRAAELIAERSDWPRLYDPGQLSRNNVPVAAVVYFDDMYVAQEFSVETARRIKGARAWVTNEYEHDGLRKDGGRVLDRLLSMSSE